jgi:hypothetical protein
MTHDLSCARALSEEGDGSARRPGMETKKAEPAS